MSDAEKEAMEWLRGLIGAFPSRSDPAVTLLALLAEPRLPAAPTDAQVEDIWQATAGGAGRTHRQYVEDVLAGIREALTAPKTKTVEVWRVEYTSRTGEPATNTKTCKILADDEADRLRVLGCLCIHITGPHTQEVPA